VQTRARARPGVDDLLWLARGVRNPRASPARRRPLDIAGMKTLLNVVWLVLAGFWLAAAYFLAAILLAITIIGLPFAKQSLKLARYAQGPETGGATRAQAWLRRDIGLAVVGPAPISVRWGDGPKPKAFQGTKLPLAVWA